MAVTQADNQRGSVISPQIVHPSEQQVSAHRNRHAECSILDDFTLPQRTASGQPRENQPDGQQQKEQPCTSGDTQFLFAVDGNVGRHDPIRKSVANHSEALAPTFQQKEPVEREGRPVFHGRTRWQTQGRIDDPSDSCQQQRQRKKPIVAMDGSVDGQCDGRADGRRDIVAQSVVADALRTARRGQHIDSHRAVGNGRKAERRSVQRTHDGEKEQRPRCQITGEEERKKEIADQQHRLTRKRIDHIAAQHPHRQSRKRIARQHDADSLLVGAERLAEVERQ